jgi:iron complex transport system substrate-binding protein
MKQRLSQVFQSFLLAIMAFYLVSACEGNAPKNGTANLEVISSDSSECQVVKHPLGKTQICGEPQQIVALDQHILGLMLSLGVQPAGYAGDSRALVGSPKSGEPITQIKYLGERITSDPIFIGIRQQPSLETMLRLKPDLILKDWHSPSFYPELSEIAPTLFFRYESGQYHWQQSLLILGQVLKREQRAQKVIEEHNQRVARARSELKSLTGDSEILLLSMSGLDQIRVSPRETFAGDLLRNLGFKLVTPEGMQANSGEVQISLETLPQLNADRIIVMASSNSSVEQIEKAWEENSILRSLPASKAGQVYFVDFQLWGRIRGPIAAELMIEQIRSFLLEPN